ncbi:trace amine-associated receptor 13c-like [Conger conger]|uniref:trace amine-associated receptor 13c-like n=1 Tax=Conger conger TaxID=82655 RepID=UPI002A5A5B29|nr:trace amine-associated receptor 13c-like [Conger conger]
MCVAAVIFVTVSGNLLVIISICHFKQLHTPTNFILLSLAMADFLVGATVMPFYFIELVDPYWCIGGLNCIMKSVSSFLTYATCVSIYSVVLIAVDRLFAISNPFLYSTKMTVKLTMRVISIVWLCALVYNTMLRYCNGNLNYMMGNTQCVDCSISLSQEWVTADFFVIFVVPLTTIILIYLKIFAIAKKHANNITCARKQQSDSKKCNAMASERKAAKTLSIIVAVFLLCLLPYFISVVLYVYFSKPSVYLSLVHSVSILHINSAINPIIYALFYSWFQKSVKLILTLRICAIESSLMNVLAKET